MNHDDYEQMWAEKDRQEKRDLGIVLMGVLLTLVAVSLLFGL